MSKIPDYLNNRSHFDIEEDRLLAAYINALESEIECWRKRYGTSGQVGLVGSTQCRFCGFMTAFDEKNNYHSGNCVFLTTVRSLAAIEKHLVGMRGVTP